MSYIVTGFVGRRGYVTADELVEMDRYGIEIGAHTVNHVDLARTQQPWLSYQLVESKSWLHSQADRYAWGRVRVSSGEPMTMFIANLGPSMPTVTVTRAVVETTPAALQQRT